MYIVTEWHDEMTYVKIAELVWHVDMTDWHGKRRNDVGGGIREGRAGLMDLTFLGRGRAREGGQHNPPKYIIFFLWHKPINKDIVTG